MNLDLNELRKRAGIRLNEDVDYNSFPYKDEYKEAVKYFSEFIGYDMRGSNPPIHREQLDKIYNDLLRKYNSQPEITKKLTAAYKVLLTQPMPIAKFRSANQASEWK